MSHFSDSLSCLQGPLGRPPPSSKFLSPRRGPGFTDLSATRDLALVPPGLLPGLPATMLPRSNLSPARQDTRFSISNRTFSVLCPKPSKIKISNCLLQVLSRPCPLEPPFPVPRLLSGLTGSCRLVPASCTPISPISAIPPPLGLCRPFPV